MIIPRDSRREEDEFQGRSGSDSISHVPTVPRRGGARGRGRSGLPSIYREYRGPNTANSHPDVHHSVSDYSDDDHDAESDYLALFNRLSLRAPALAATPTPRPRTPKLASVLLPLNRENQKDVIGEILYPTVQIILRGKEQHLAYARKIVGMLMELSIVTLLDLQRNVSILEIHVNEMLENLRRRRFDPNGPEANQLPVFSG